jgi:alpha-N-acetylglucosamine transferase
MDLVLDSKLNINSHFSSQVKTNVLQYLNETQDINEHYHVFQDPSIEEEGFDILDFDRSNIKYIYPEIIEALYDSVDKNAVDWTRYAYVLYATSSSHMCNAMMIFAELRKFNTQAQLVLLVRNEFLTDREHFQHEYTTLTDFANSYNVILKPTEVIQIGGDSVSIWTSSFTKLMVFNETEYDRVIYLDSDAILLRGNLDELFFLPSVKLAVSTAYWLTKKKYIKMGQENIERQYNPSHYGFKKLTSPERDKKVSNLITETIHPFIDPQTGLFPVGNYDTHPLAGLREGINKKNFETNIYNNLPNYPALKEFDLTNIVMVIEPSKDLFKKILHAIENKRKDEFDMELVQNHLFEVFDILDRQNSSSFANASPDFSLKRRYEETPELLILPHQVYGTITPELNSETDHRSYAADAHEQIFTHLDKSSSTEPAYYEVNDVHNVGDYLYSKMKYLHFSDAPIPKPWFLQKPRKEYMTFRTRCPSHPDYQDEENIAQPKYTTRDCSSAKNWEGAHHLFKTIRKEVCGLDLIDTDEDTYHKIIN